MLNVTANSTSKNMVIGQGYKMMLVILMLRMCWTTQTLKHSMCTAGVWLSIYGNPQPNSLLDSLQPYMNQSMGAVSVLPLRWCPQT